MFEEQKDISAKLHSTSREMDQAARSILEGLEAAGGTNGLEATETLIFAQELARYFTAMEGRLSALQEAINRLAGEALSK